MAKRNLFALVTAVPLALITTTIAAEPGPRIAPIQSHPHGQTYSEWAAAWWQWALETPADVNPLLDTTGANCAVNQTDHVWFLAALLGPGTVTRSCTIPNG